ncbi:MAG: DUF4349 domain-containing protein [Labilithrix sp.]|nr:DUF4349 domain-containing protein [Labilithrix sp.]MCW5815382.1 DUF4349 domain-containing protein [Labilithrix sp.]
MQTPSKLLALVLFLLLAAGCAQKSEPAAAAASHAGASEVAVNAPPSAERSRIVTMDMTITVDRFDDALAELRASVDRAGGYVSDMHAQGAKGGETARLEIRVPADRAQNVRGSLAALGEITNATEKVEDVTEQRADLEARLANTKVQEKRLLEIMANKSGSIADLVETEKELARVRENVERLEAQQRSLKGKVDLATIHVTLESRSTPAWKTPGKSLAGAAKAGTDGACAAFVYGAMAFLAVAPTILPIAAAIGALVLFLRRRRTSQLTAATG